MITLSGRSTASTRGARRFRSSRTQCSRSATSMMLSFLATPTRSQKSRIASGVNAAPAQADDRRHARIVPARDVLLDDELQQLALAHHRVGQVEAGELDLLRARRHRQVGEQPVVERPVILELERAQRVRDLLDGVRDRMRVVVDRIDRPLVAGAMVRDAPHAIEHRVAHVDVRRRHVDLRAQHAARRPRTRRRASARTGRGSPPPSGRGTGCSAPARSACRGTRGSRRRSGCRRRPGRSG